LENGGKWETIGRMGTVIEDGERVARELVIGAEGVAEDGGKWAEDGGRSRILKDQTSI
jgi:hypothetical protein